LASKEILEQAMSDYGGTLLFVSHDRYLLNKVPDKIIEITANGADIYAGNYETYCEVLERQARLEAEELAKKAYNEALNTKKASTGNSFRSKEQRKADTQKKLRINELEKFIENCETRLAELENEMTLESVFSDYKLMEEKCKEADRLRQELDHFFEEWEALCD
jgi:ATP-binding cassette subfamily F protein 3